MAATSAAASASAEFDLETYLEEEEAKRPTTIQASMFRGKFPDEKQKLLQQVMANRRAEQKWIEEQRYAIRAKEAAEAAATSKAEEDYMFSTTTENVCACQSSCSNGSCTIDSRCPSAKLCNANWWTKYVQPSLAMGSFGIVPKPAYCKACETPGQMMMGGRAIIPARRMVGTPRRRMAGAQRPFLHPRRAPPIRILFPFPARSPMYPPIYRR